MADFPTTGSPPMIGRVLNVAEWRAYLASYDFGPVAPTRLVLHHTWKPTLASWRGLASMRGMQHYYHTRFGWSSAPHIYVAPDGIWLFTPMSRVGIHAGTGNQGTTNGVWWYSIGLEMVGNYDRVRPAGAVWEYARTVMGTLSQRLDIPPRRLISFHRDYTNEKSCPGWAVTHQWVYAEVEAWLNNRPPPPPPPEMPIGRPAPETEMVFERLMIESYTQRGGGYHVGWAFHQYGVQNGLGMALDKSQRLTIADKEYSYQPFARDTLYSEVPNWGQVQRLSELLGGSIPPGGLGRALLDATYQSGGVVFQVDQPFHLYAFGAQLGPPMHQQQHIQIEDRTYAFQVFAGDTLYAPVDNPTDIQQLGQPARSPDQQHSLLREVLRMQSYQQAGSTYNPNWIFHQLAGAWNLGTPLSDAYGVDIEGIQYNIQVYAYDTLYNIVPNWQNVRRLSALNTPPAAPVLGSASLAAPDPLPTAALPAVPPFRVLTYTSMVAVSSYSHRSDVDVSLVVLHGDSGPAKATLEYMVEPGATVSTHYYITTTGLVYRLVAEESAAWHAGIAIWDGRWQHINQMSIGIVLERPPQIPPQSHTYETQREALRWLVQAVAVRHDLSQGAVVRWLDLAPNQTATHSIQPLADIAIETLAGR